MVNEIRRHALSCHHAFIVRLIVHSTFRAQTHHLYGAFDIRKHGGLDLPVPLVLDPVIIAAKDRYGQPKSWKQEYESKRTL
jgi:hypothetical protein